MKRRSRDLKNPFIAGADVGRLKFEGFWHKSEPPHVGSYNFMTRSNAEDAMRLNRGLRGKLNVTPMFAPFGVAILFVPAPSGHSFYGIRNEQCHNHRCKHKADQNIKAEGVHSILLLWKARPDQSVLFGIRGGATLSGLDLAGRPYPGETRLGSSYPGLCCVTPSGYPEDAGP